MKFKDYFFIARKNFFHKKINIVTIFLLVVSMTLIIFVASFSKTFNTFVENQINGNINHHVLLVSNHADKLELSDIDNVAYTTKFNSYIAYVESENGEEITLIGVPDNYLEVLNGKNFNDVSNDNVMICPAQFYLGSSPEQYDEEFIKNLKDGEDYIDKTFILIATNYSEEYKIIGTYDVNKYMDGEYNVCFTKQENITVISNREIEYLKQECDNSEDDCGEVVASDTTIIVVKDVKKIDNTIEQLEKKGYVVRALMEFDSTGLNFFSLILILISIVVLTVTFIIILLYNNKFIQYNKKNNLIYKAMGYSNNILININYLEYIILSFVSLLITIIICIILYNILYYIFIVDIKTGCPIYISYFSIIFSFAISLIISFLSVHLSISNNKKAIIEELSDEEI